MNHRIKTRKENHDSKVYSAYSTRKSVKCKKHRAGRKLKRRNDIAERCEKRRGGEEKKMKYNEMKETEPN